MQSALLPRRLRERVEMTRHDLRMLARSLLGKAPPHLVPRRTQRGWTTAPRRSVIAWETMCVTEVVRETPDATTLVLARPDGRALEFEAGQFLSVELEVDGQTLRRAYSLSSAPSDGRTTITVKRVNKGRVSNHLNDRIAPGAMLRVRGPSGSFAAPTTDELVMIAGGSGITPLFAIAREVSKRAPDTRLTLIYGNRSPRDAIFAKALAEMADAGRLVFDPVFESAPPEHPGPHGVLDRAMIEARLDALRIDTASATFLICGPTPMRAACRAALEARDVAPEAIREEIFVRPERVDDGKPLPKDKVTVSIRVGADVRDVVVAPGRTLLEAGLSAGAALPYSCTMGGCAACRVRLVKGEVRMEEPNCLTDDERARGYVLACVSRPLGACEVEVEP